MYNEEKVKSEIYLVQKQALASKMNALSEELEKRKYQFDE